MTQRIYYVGRHVSMPTLRQLRAIYGEQISSHVTIIYSRQWFPYKTSLFMEGIAITAPGYEFANFGNLTVLCFQSLILRKRHQEFLDSGASWDYEDYKMHITLGMQVDTSVLPTFPLILDNEYYRTWEQESKS